MLGKTTNMKSYKMKCLTQTLLLLISQSIITSLTLNQNMTYNTWTMININSTIFTDRTIAKVTIRN